MRQLSISFTLVLSLVSSAFTQEVDIEKMNKKELKDYIASCESKIGLLNNDLNRANERHSTLSKKRKNEILELQKSNEALELQIAELNDDMDTLIEAIQDLNEWSVVKVFLRTENSGIDDVYDYYLVNMKKNIIKHLEQSWEWGHDATKIYIEKDKSGRNILVREYWGGESDMRYEKKTREFFKDSCFTVTDYESYEDIRCDSIFYEYNDFRMRDNWPSDDQSTYFEHFIEFKNNVLIRELKSWDYNGINYERGQIRSERVWQNNILISQKCWDTNGILMDCEFDPEMELQVNQEYQTITNVLGL